MVKVKATELRTKAKKDLIAKANELRGELAQLRIGKVTNAAASKLARINEVRKNIARVLTVLNQKKMDEARAATQKLGLQRVPKRLRAKKTRAIRRALTPHQKSLKTERALKKEQNFPLRKFALKA